jgi:hypothetical protein
MLLADESILDGSVVPRRQYAQKVQQSHLTNCVCKCLCTNTFHTQRYYEWLKINVGHFRPQVFLSFDIHVGRLHEMNSGDGLLVDKVGGEEYVTCYVSAELRIA